MPRRSRTNWPLRLTTSCLFLVWIGYLSWPLLQELPPDAGRNAFENHPVEQLRERGITTLTHLWFFFFGASIGSFLNVVAYRMPMGLTIVSKPSRCPYCMTTILFRDNIPLLGWIALRGRCRACRLPISVRYVLVELLVGLLFVTYFVAELASGGTSLPVREAQPSIGRDVECIDAPIGSHQHLHVPLLPTQCTQHARIDPLR